MNNLPEISTTRSGFSTFFLVKPIDSPVENPYNIAMV